MHAEEQHDGCAVVAACAGFGHDCSWWESSWGTTTFGRRTVGEQERRAAIAASPPTSCMTMNIGTARRRDAGEGVGEGAADGDRGVGEAGRRGEPVGGGDVAADRERRHVGTSPSATTPRMTSRSRRWRRPRRATARSPDRCVGGDVDGGEVEHEVRDHGAEARADDLGDDVDDRVARWSYRRAPGRRA